MPSEIDRLSQNLLDIVENVEAALRFVKGVTKEEFVSDQMRSYAAVRALEIISEASRRVPEDIAALYPIFLGARYVTRETSTGTFIARWI